MPAAKRNSTTAAFSKLKVVPRSAQVREHLEASIARGTFRPGERLPSERELTEIFGVSRVSVREAIRSLDALGMVEVRQGQGCFVATPADRRARTTSPAVTVHREEALELLRVRGALDGLAARQAAARADGDGVAAIREAHVAFGLTAASADHGGAELRELDVAFHLAVAQASGNELLANLLGDLHRDGIDASRELAYAPSDAARRSAREHGEILAAIEGRDQAAAAAAAAAHLARVVETVSAELGNRSAAPA